MWFGLLALLSCGCVLLLAGVRMRNRDSPPLVLAHLAALGAAIGGTVTLIWLADLAGVLDFIPNMAPSGVLGAAWSGMWAGSALYLAIILTQQYVGPALFRWACRLPSEETTMLKVQTVLAGWFGWAACLALVFAAADLAITLELPAIVLAPLVAIIPLYNTMVLPWLRYFRAPVLQLSAKNETERQFEAIQTWLNELSAKRRMPPLHMRVQHGELVNAYAMGGMFRHLIVIGGGLLSKMSSSEIKGIIAHEIAHVIRRDVLFRLLPVCVLASISYFALHMLCVGPLEAKGYQVTGFFLAISYAAVAFGALPGYVMRRAEYGADKLAVALLGEREPLVNGLLKIAELKGQNLDFDSGTHPPIRKRIAAIHALALPADGR